MIKRANAEKWTEQRQEAYELAAKKAQREAARRVASAAARNADKLEQAREQLIDRILAAIEQMPRNAGTHVRQSQTEKGTGKQMSVDYDLQTLVLAFEKLSTGQTADYERQSKYAAENKETMTSYADLFKRPAKQRTLEEVEGEKDV